VTKTLYKTVNKGEIMEFWHFNHSIINSSQQMIANYHLSTVALSVFIMFLASLAVNQVVQVINNADTPSQSYIWVASGSLVFGLGIWAMHFISMLAFHLPVIIAYDLYMTLLSIPPAIIAGGIYTTLLTKKKYKKSHFYVSCFCFAIGIVSMHFLGMEVLKADAIMHYQAKQFIVIIVLALLFSTVSLYFSPIRNTTTRQHSFSCITSPLITAFSIAGIHYAAMWETDFYTTTSTTFNDSLFSRSQLSILIALAVSLLILILFIAIKISNRFKQFSPLSNDFVRAIVDNSAEAIITINENSLVLSFNQTAEKIFGYHQTEIIGKNISLLLPENLRSVHDGYVKNSTIHKARIFNSARDLMALKKDGTLFPIELNVSPMNTEGEKTFVGIIHDITARKRNEQLLAESQNRFKQLTELSSDWIWETDQNHKVSYLSDSFHSMTGHDLDTFLGEKRELISIYESNDNDWAKYTETLDQQHTLKNFKFTLKNADDELLYMMINGSPIINDDGVFIGYRGTGSNISELTKAQKDAEKANVAKSEFLSSMSHELRTPLNAILGFSQLMTDDPDEPLTENQKDSVDYILKSGKHLLTLINDILDLSKIESGHIDLSIEPITLNDILDECISLIKPFAETHEISIQRQTKPDENLQILADYTRIKQVILNLLSNAIKYNSKKGTVTLICEPVENDRLHIIIKDTGPGIPEENQIKLFSPFERLGAENSEIEGTGIGLIVCKELMEKMHGTINFKSKEGQGSSFWAEIPLAMQISSAHQITESILDEQEFVSTDISGTILYIEDNPANLHLLERIIARFPDINLISTHTAELGISIASSKDISLILMDINLPGINGIEAFHELRANPKTHIIPIVAVSANATQRDIKRGTDAGFNHYLSKPFHIPDMHKIIEQYCIKA